ncbi:tRNA epoxyqueuosine(34) reductase QueG [Caldichromatium japonicum]|uniref:Epoxyqueuosine reductase n=1 Tax=Caldichromatium japonicum TaxID=2699430 RepID=A0A6G7VE50_9GAMM|nr:tRNA epoxyqueuosine(34) reductase QueG [Caldichromatium japonicum]QIK38128.1 tRNA epoxyqueuosine(34) reductase QueG [Caldichromatium japonicum]
MPTLIDPQAVVAQIKDWGRGLGFQQVGVADTDLAKAEAHLWGWLARGYHGEMAFMARHGSKRTRPSELVPGTLSVISVRMDYRPEPEVQMRKQLADPAAAFISRYALGRDYHKVLRQRLQRLAQRLTETIGPFGYRVFVDSAPVMEKPLAAKAGLGWIGKHSNLIHPRAGSWFFLGEIYTDLPLPPDQPIPDHCGRCSRCLQACPTGAIVAPYQVDARRCVSYLTIELKGAIPEDLRPLLGNRIFGCDDCQIACPWNRFALNTAEQDFASRHSLDTATLIALFAWDEETFFKYTAGSAIRRIGYERWLRNLAVALGNAQPVDEVRLALKSRLNHPSPLVREHVAWALRRTGG